MGGNDKMLISASSVGCASSVGPPPNLGAGGGGGVVLTPDGC